ncbi:MAG: DUF11 domain-containing protein [Saprospiraceae bacterium]|nr:DUF11 domain-containing protein [Saprospiraceae bacterium]HRG32603.1 SdrD B-like domain-containing protein [Saprospiraceae bacterium]
MNYLKLLFYSFSLVFLILLSSFQRLHAQTCPTILSAGGMIEVCKGGTVDLFAELNVAPTGIKFTWTGSFSGLLKMATGPAGTFMSYTPTVTEVVTITAEKAGCTTLVDKVKVIVHDGATFTKCRIIDNFDEPDGTTQQTVQVKSPILGGPIFETKTFTGLNAGGLIGNKRTMNIWYVVGDLTSRADVLKESDITSPYFNEWFYSSSNDEGNESNTELVYGGTGANQLNWDGICDCLDPNGKPDATAGFRLYNYFADQSGVTMTVTITDGSGNTGTISRNMPGSGFGDYDEEFSLLDFTVANGFNWCDIDKISLYMNTNFISVDFKFDQFDFCCLVKAELGDNSIKKCLGSCIKLDTLFNCPIPSGLIGSHNVNWKDPNGNSVAYNALICPSTAGMFNYTVNIKDSLGCESNFTQTFKICDTPSVSIPNVAICKGKSVVLSPTITGGNAPLSYLWSPATGLSCTTCANPTANPTTTTTYTLIVSTTENGDNGINACSGSRQVTVTVNDLPDGSITGATGLCNGATTTQICAKQAPAANITYSWSTLETTRCINVGAGTYTLTVTNTTTGCTATSQVTISPVPSPSVTVSSDKNNVCEGTKVILTAVGSGGTTPYTFTWSTGQSGNPIQVTPSAPSSTYIVTITDINGCTGTNTITINATPNDIQVNVTTKPDICSKKIGEATANPTGGAPPYSYAWSNGGNTQTITGLSPGSYTVTVTDISGCSRSATGTVGTVAGPSVNITGASPICAGGSVTLTANATGGTAPITYSWSPGGMTTSAVTVSPGSTTTYTVVVTDGNGCTASNSVEVFVNPKPQVTITPVNPVICNGFSVNLTAITSGGTPTFSYLWSPSTGLSCTTCQNPDASPTADQNYQVIVTDSKGCKDTAQVLVKVNNNPTPSLVGKTNEQCGKKNGTITVTATGGVSPYSYLWNTSPQQTGTTATGLAGGTYTVTVTDKNGCTGTFSTSIINEGGPTVNITGTNPNCIGDNVTLTANPSPKLPSEYTYQWSAGLGTNQTATINNVLITNDYHVTITDKVTGCTATATYTVQVIGCAVVTHFKEFVGVTQTGLNTYDVAFKITVDNIGTGNGKYNLKDSLAFDKDVVVNAIKYSTNAVGNPGNPGTIVPPSDGNNRYDLAVNQNITDVEVHVYNLTVSVTLNLAGTPPPGGDGSYKPCAEVTPGDYIPENGLYNLSILDTPNDFNDERDEACGELPIINHEKSGPVVVKQGPNTYEVTYTIKVTNSGYATGKYTLNDIPGLENDFEVLSAQYTSTAPGNPANPGPIGLTLSGPWNLANDQNILKQTTHTYQVKLQVKIDLVATASVGDEIYTPCGTNNPNVPQSGEGLFNRTTLDVNDDGIPDQRDTVCADIKIIDLALRKVILNPAGSYKYGDNITFRITVFNQGNTAVENVQVADYLPAGLKYEGGDPNWTIVSANELEGTLPGVLNPGASKTIDLTLRIVASSGGSFDWINFAEIKKAFIGTDEVSDEDIDSDPYSNSTKENAVKPGSPDDNVITEDGKNNPEEDEDDHDPAGIEVFDLALKKTTTAIGPFQYGSVVPFVITVYNQGSIQARDVVVVDYIPSGFAFGPGNAIWTNGISMATTTIPSINPGSSVNVTINLVVQTGSNPLDRAWYNEAEIKTAKDDKNITQTEDIDSRFNMNPDDDNDVVIDGADDNEINEDGKNDPQQDEDDNDPAAIKIWDLALKKVFVSGSIKYNNPLTFRIWVYNQGNETAKDVKIADYIPTGYSFSAGLNPGWAGSYPNVNYTLAGPIVPGDSAFVDIVLTLENTSGGFRKWINYSEIVSSKDLNNADRSNDDIDSRVGSDGPSERAVLPGSINDNNISSTNKGGEEDDHDPAGTGIMFGEIFDLALRKTVITPAPYGYGQDIDFNIRIFNQGNVTAQNINVVDYVPAGFQFIAGGVNVAWSYAAGLSQASRIVSGPLKPGDSLDITIRLRTIANPGSSTAYINFSEIKSAQDSLGATRADIDSNPDDNPINDIGGEPGGPTDNLIDDDGTIDEDDLDPALINVYDLALIKVTSTAGPYSVGQVVDFKITVYNQGTLPVKNVVVNDYIPIGYTYNAGDNAGIWSGSHPLVTHTHAPQLNPGDNFEVILKLRLAGTSGGYTNWINYSEIKSMQSVNGTDVSAQDVDSDPNGNTPGETAVTPGSPNDNNITDITKAADQDDHDPAGVNIFDLALRKTVVTGGPYAYGQDIDFKITVFNQGNSTAKNISVVDYVPAGYQFIAGGVNAGWTYSAGNRQATRTIAGPLTPGQSIDVTIRLRLIANASSSDAYTNFAEIKSAQDSLGVSGNDFDSDPDDDPTNDDGGEPGGPTDDEVTKAPPVDEDDHDPAIISIFDLALIKKLVTPATGPYTYGQTHTFEITVFNQGNVTAKDIQVKDYIPEGYSFSPNNGWTGASPMVSKTITDTIQPGGSRTITLNLTFNMVAVPSLKSWANYAEIVGANDQNGVPGDDVDSDPGSNTTNEQNVIPGKPGDDDISSISDSGIGSQDDHDPAGPWVFDLATIIENSVDRISSYGELINFPIKVKNQGNINSAGYTLSVLVPTGFAYTAGPNAGWSYNSLTRIATYVVPVTDTIKPGEMDMYNLVLTSQPATGKHAWTVEIEISADNPVADEAGINDIDSNPDAVYNNDPGGSPIPDSEGGNFPGSDDILNGAGNGIIGDTNAAGDEDDNDPEYVKLYDLALKKTVVTPQPYSYGQNLVFRLRVYNQGNESVKNVRIQDYIPVGYSFVASPGWAVNGQGAVYTYGGTLNPTDSFDINITLKLEHTVGGYRNWINYAEITDVQDTLGNNVNTFDVDSRPGSNGSAELAVKPGDAADDNITSIDKGGEEDDHDPAGVPIFDVALRKNYIGPLPIKYNQVIPFEVTVFNQGSISAQNFEIADYLAPGFDFDVASNPTWTYNPVTRIATTIYTPKVIPGDSAKVVIKLKVRPTLYNRAAWKNFAEIITVTDTTNTPGDDIDSDPDDDPDNDGPPEDGEIDENPPIDEDDHDPADPPVVDFALRKWIPGKKPYYIPGDTVDFIISLHNQGNVASSSIGVNDYIPAGFQFLPAINGGWSVNGTRLEYSYGTRLYPEDSVQLHLKLKVIVSANPTLSDWENYAEIRTMRDTFNLVRDNDDADSKPNTDDAWERAVHDDEPWDDVIDGNGQVENEDSDDHDPEKVVVTAWIGDFVWKDLDGDGVQDAGEPGVPGVHVYLYKCADGSIVKKDTTDANGKYEFDFLLSDNYFLRFDPLPINMPNCAFTFKDKGGNDAKDSDVSPSGITACTFLQWGERDSTWDAGLVELAKYGDYVWHDRDADGVQEVGEEGIKDVVVTLYDADTRLPVKTTTTDATGKYLFEYLMPGNYYAKFEWHPMWNQTTSNQGSDTKDSDVDGSNGSQTTASTYLSPGEDDRTWDLGLYKCIMIGGRVFLDKDKDGIFDPTENGLNGLDVYLVDAMSGAVVANLRTAVNPSTPSDDGYYKFACIKPGMYHVKFERPGHLAASEPFKGGNTDKDSDISHEFGVNTTRKFTVLSGDMILNVGAGFQDKATLGDRVWLDRNFNGIQDGNEEPVQGVKVAAYTPGGVMVSEATSGFDGTYMLDGVAQGDYYVKFTAPVSFGFTIPHTGSDNVDNDVDGTNGYGTTRVYRVQTGDAFPTIDAGLVYQVLPLEWLSFEANYNGEFTELDWATGVEINNGHFEVERRHESETEFKAIGQVDASIETGASRHDYEMDDLNVNQSGLYYYRIKQVDRDGKYNYSKVISIRVQRGKDLSIEIYPNPVDDLLKVEIGLSENGLLESRVFDNHGKSVLVNPFGGNYIKAGKYSELINTSVLTPGQYNLQIKTNNGLINKRFTVSR